MKKAIWIAIAIIGLTMNSCFFLICGCTDPEPYPDTKIDVVVKNKAGEDMLNAVTKGFFSIDDIELFYIENGNKISMTKSEFDIKTGVQWDANTFDYRLYRISIQSHYKMPDVQAITLLEFKDIRTDTLTCYYSGWHMTEIKVNGKVTWNADSNKYNAIEITVDR